MKKAKIEPEEQIHPFNHRNWIRIVVAWEWKPQNQMNKFAYQEPEYLHFSWTLFFKKYFFIIFLVRASLHDIFSFYFIQFCFYFYYHLIE